MNEPSDPKRLIDDAASSELGRLMASAGRDLPSERELAQLAERLGSVLGRAHAAPSVPRGYSMLTKLGVVTGLGALIAAGLFAARKQPSRPSAASVAPVALVASAKSPAQSSSVPAPAALDAPGIASASSANARASASPSTNSAIVPSKAGGHATGAPSEVTLLEQARRTLASDPAAALALTNQHATLFPRGVLAQEREVIAIEALRRLNRSAEADRRAAAFGKAFPGSAHQRVVEDSSAQ